MFNKKYFIVLSGFIWGLTGYSSELSESDTIMNLLQLVFILISSLIIVTTLKFKIHKKYFPAIGLIFMYIGSYIVSSILYGIELKGILRELFFIVIMLVLYILYSNKNCIEYFLYGLFLSIISIIIFYFLHIDFLNFFNVHYRIEMRQGSNAIGFIGVMAFIIAFYSIFSEDFNRIKKIFIIVSILAFVVVISTKSRTALLMLSIAFFIINIYFKNTKIIIISFISVFLFVFWKFDMLEAILRLQTPEGYAGGKNIYNLTGRTDLWLHALDVIKNNLLFGVGPANAFVMVDDHRGTYHNAYIQLLVEIGLMGSLPIFVLILQAFRKVIYSKRFILIKIIFVVGFLVTLVEHSLLNFGSPANLLFLMTFLYLIDFKMNTTILKSSKEYKNNEKGVKRA